MDTTGVGMVGLQCFLSLFPLGPAPFPALLPCPLGWFACRVSAPSAEEHPHGAGVGQGLERRAGQHGRQPKGSRLSSHRKCITQRLALHLRRAAPEEHLSRALAQTLAVRRFGTVSSVALNSCSEMETVNYFAEKKVPLDSH